jgi:hypothetical protein
MCGNSAANSKAPASFAAQQIEQAGLDAPL